MFSGMTKILFLTAPVIAIVMFFVFVKMNKQEAKMDVESAKFDQDFAVMQKTLSNTKSEKQHWTAKEKEAVEQIELAKKLEQDATGVDKELNTNMIDAAKEFGKNATVDGNGKVINKESK